MTRYKPSVHEDRESHGLGYGVARTLSLRMIEDPDGQYVRWEDYALLMQANKDAHLVFGAEVAKLQYHTSEREKDVEMLKRQRNAAYEVARDATSINEIVLRNLTNVQSESTRQVLEIRELRAKLKNQDLKD